MSAAVKEALADVEIDGGEDGPARRCVVGRAGPDAGRARLRLQRVQHPGLHDGHAGPAGQRHPAQGRRQLPAALRRRHRRRRHRAALCSAISTSQGLHTRQGDAAARRQRRPLRGHAHRARSPLGRVRRAPRCSARPTPSRRSCRRWAARSATTSSPTSWACPPSGSRTPTPSCSQHAPDEHILMPLCRSARGGDGRALLGHRRGQGAGCPILRPRRLSGRWRCNP